MKSFEVIPLNYVALDMNIMYMSVSMLIGGF